MYAQDVRVETLLNIRHHATTHASVVSNFIVWKSTTSVPEFFCEGTMLTLSVF